MMLPSTIVGRLNFIPTKLRFGVTIGLFDERPLTFTLGENKKSAFGRCVAGLRVWDS